ncbi:hypothetical protein Xcel_1890 [Xylanimonas cellulosilytica DSM 15894]|uniref:Uncharacterized protein n=1 Tax=Xylanimonas cellulosilytica (strain DSM 15894 / JCM 12276 / CECT 5975 / KCTC 9989 / LMG 20990 / NBRC 107835 / XIL07) TaxID=446471 RepID=D1BT67_XYLCX|nr:DUF3000 domain-containing protein [Xylanimonas cellulosilytica]ACZ30909.1 hypothetical protein Xcel_1890 [Xylanimonas cellulosilytica DSM 15894]
MTSEQREIPARFAAALQSLRRPRLRPEVHLTEVPGPGRISPWSAALEGEVTVGGLELATGRFVVLHDPGGQETWQGDFRVVTLVRASLEPEMAADPLLGEVAWSWVTEAFDDAGISVLALGGTVTRVLSNSFGALAGTPDAVDLELRASWTPTDTALGTHLHLWADLMATVGGLPPLPDGVTALGPRRTGLR